MKTAPARQHPKKTEERVSTHVFVSIRNVRTPEDVRRADAVSKLVEGERGDDGACFAARGGHAVRGGAEASREHLCGVALCTRAREPYAYKAR